MWSPTLSHALLLCSCLLADTMAWSTSPNHVGLRSMRSLAGLQHPPQQRFRSNTNPMIPSPFAVRLSAEATHHRYSSATEQQQHRRRNNGKPLTALAVDESDGSKLAFVETESSSQQQLQQQSTAAIQTTASHGFDFASMDREELISKAINAVFLAVCFGLAIYSIVNINQGMTRGWTQSEIAMRIPLDTWSSYEAALEESPVATKTMINVIIYLLGDWLSQTVFAQQNVLEFDLQRTLRNGLIGLCFGPLVHEYYQFSDAVLPVEGGLGNRILKIFMDQTLYLSVKCSLYIMAVNTLQGEDLETSTRAVKDKIGGIVVTAWKFWPLIHCITYTVIPARHRILWVNCVDLVWNAILASLASKQTDAATEEEEQDLINSGETSVAKVVDVTATESPLPSELVLSSMEETSATATTSEGRAHTESLSFNTTDVSKPELTEAR